MESVQAVSPCKEKKFDDASYVLRTIIRDKQNNERALYIDGLDKQTSSWTRYIDTAPPKVKNNAYFFKQ